MTARGIAGWAERQRSGGRFPGAAWWVESGDRVVSSGISGDAALVPQRRPLTTATSWDLASLTKPMCTALLLAQAHRRGELDLDEPAARWLPELGGTVAGQARLKELARHGSGLPAWRALYVGGGGAAHYLARIGAEPREATDTLYSDLGYIVLGFVLERATGSSLAALFRERIAAPLGLAALTFPAPGECVDAAAVEEGSRYEASLAGGVPGEPPFRRTIPPGEVHDGNAHGLGGAAGHAGLFGPLAEVAALARAILRPSPLELGEGGRRWLFRPGPDGLRTVGFVTAAGSRAARGILPDSAPGHVGFTGTSLWLDPASDRFFLLLTNRVHPRVDPRDFQLVRRAFHRVALASL